MISVSLIKLMISISLGHLGQDSGKRWVVFRDNRGGRPPGVEGKHGAQGDYAQDGEDEQPFGPGSFDAGFEASAGHKQPGNSQGGGRRQISFAGITEKGRQQGGGREGGYGDEDMSFCYGESPSDRQHRQSSCFEIVKAKDRYGMEMGDLPEGEDRKQEECSEIETAGCRTVTRHRRHGPGQAADGDTERGSAFQVEAVGNCVDEKPPEDEGHAQGVGFCAEQSKSSQGQKRSVKNCDFLRHKAPGQDTVAGSLHQPVHIPVRQVVKDAAGSDHHGNAGDGCGQQGRIRPAPGGEEKTAGRGDQVAADDPRFCDKQIMFEFCQHANCAAVSFPIMH